MIFCVLQPKNAKKKFKKLKTDSSETYFFLWPIAILSLLFRLIYFYIWCENTQITHIHTVMFIYYSIWTWIDSPFVTDDIQRKSITTYNQNKVDFAKFWVYVFVCVKKKNQVNDLHRYMRYDVTQIIISIVFNSKLMELLQQQQQRRRLWNKN